MSFPPNQSAAAGEKKSLYRAIYNDGNSQYLAVAGGKTYVSIGAGGNAHFNYDDAEGWAPRITYHGTTETSPFEGVSNSTNGGQTNNKSYGSGLTSLRRKDEGAASSTVGTSGRVIEIRNGRSSGEVYTTHYHNLPYTDQNLITTTPVSGKWYVCWYARKSNSAPSNTGTVRQTLYVFSTKIDGSNNYVYNFTGNSGGNATSSTIASPDTGHTYYYAQNDMTTSWTKYDMCFEFDASNAGQFLTMRLDNDDGRYGQGGVNSTTKVYIDRVTLHPMDVGLQASGVDQGSNPDNLNNAFFGTYAT